MNSPARAASLSGLLSLMADALDPEPLTGDTSTAEIAPLQPADLAAVLGQVVRGWLSMKEDGRGWMLIQFEGRRCEPEPEPSVERDQPRTPSRVEVAARAHRVYTALTDREREVLCLVASGATNCAIGQRLFISPKTASVHVSRILTKLDATTRTEAAALAHAAGLVRPWGSGSVRELRPSAGPTLVHA